MKKAFRHREEIKFSHMVLLKFALCRSRLVLKYQTPKNKTTGDILIKKPAAYLS